MDDSQFATSESAPLDRGVDSTDASTLLDVEEALCRLEGDRDLLMAVLEAFLETAPELQTNLSSALSKGDARALAAAAHALKGAAASISANALRDLAIGLEELAMGGDVGAAKARSGDLDSGMKRTVAVIQALMKGETARVEVESPARR